MIQSRRTVLTTVAGLAAATLAAPVSRTMPFGWRASYTNADIDTPSCAWSVVGQGLTLACALADKQNASTIVARFSDFSDILQLLQRKPLDDRGLKLLRIDSRFCYARGDRATRLIPTLADRVGGACIRELDQTCNY
jgi:hypothetical protein